MSKRYRTDLENVAKSLCDLKYRDMVQLAGSLRDMVLDTESRPFDMTKTEDWASLLDDYAEAVDSEYIDSQKAPG